MPTYVVHAASRAFDSAQRDALARAITDIHHQRTGAPRSFVQTMFVDIAAGGHYIGGEPTHPRSVWVYGHIRSGRDTESRTGIALDIRDALLSGGGVPREFVWVYLAELPHTDMVEFSSVLPPPGEEDAWIEGMPPDIRDHLRALG